MILLDYVEQHCGCATFLAAQRAREATGTRFTSSDLVRHDERLEAHLDGLRVAGSEATTPCDAALAARDPGAWFVALAHALACTPERVDELLSCARHQRARAEAGLAFVWEAVPAAALASHAARHRWLPLEIAAVLHVDPGAAVPRAVIDADAELRWRGLRAAGLLGRSELRPLLRGTDAEPDPRCRRWRAWSAAMLGEDTAWQALNDEALDGTSTFDPEFDAVWRRAPATVVRGVVRELLRRGRRSRASAVAGASGIAAFVPLLLDLAADSVVPDVGEAGLRLALRWLTGVEADVAGPDLRRKLVDAVHRRWQGLDGSVARHLLGQPATPPYLGALLANGRQAERVFAAVDIASAAGGPLHAWAAPAARQVWPSGGPAPAPT